MKKIILRAAFISMVGLLFTGFIIFRQPDPESNLIRSISSKLSNYTEWYPQQKVYLHTDKSRYTIEDRVWFKAYLVDAATNVPDDRSNNLYVELINPEGFMVQAKRIKLTDGFGNGDFSFQDTVPEGRYMIRAYTNWMRNAGEDFYFKRNIYVKNPLFANYATREKVRKVKKAIRETANKQSDFDVSFHPEGGNLLLGVENKVAFKAINELGQSVDIEGDLTDSKGNVLLTASSIHSGMGNFIFTPEKDVKYVFRVKADGLESKDFKLPEGKEKGINIRVVSDNKDELKVSLSTNLGPGNYPPNTVYALIAHSGGILKYSGEIDLKSNDRSLVIPKASLPSGILHLTLFNYRESPISQRMVFINHHDFLDIEINPGTSQTGSRQKIESTAVIRDANGNPAPGSFSLAVVKIDARFTGDNILSYLLLNSDLKGEVENPEYYFTEPGSQKAEELDQLMLTQGWTRFEWPVVILNKRNEPDFPFQDGIVIGGKITRELFARPLRDIKVTLTILNEYNDVFLTRSDIDGNFMFDNLEYYDTMSVKLEAVKANGKKNLVIDIRDEITRKLKKFDYLTEQSLKKPGEEGKWMNQPIAEEDEDPFKEENEQLPRIHSEPSRGNIIILDDNMRNYQNLGQLLQGRIPGVNVVGNSVTIRGPSSFLGSQDPLFLLDGMPIDMQSAMQMSPYDVDRIEVLKGADAGIYGSRGANGVIAIYTRRGKYMKKGEIEFEMLGYITPTEFYSPRYDLHKDEEFEDNRTTLMWIPMLTADSSGKISFDFYSSDLTGEYLIIVEGISNDGKPGAGSRGFKVN